MRKPPKITPVSVDLKIVHRPGSDSITPRTARLCGCLSDHARQSCAKSSGVRNHGCARLRPLTSLALGVRSCPLYCPRRPDRLADAARSKLSLVPVVVESRRRDGRVTHEVP